MMLDEFPDACPLKLQVLVCVCCRRVTHESQGLIHGSAGRHRKKTPERYRPPTKPTAPQRSKATQSSHHPALPTPPKELSLAQILISTMYSTLYLLYIFDFFLGFNDRGVGG